MAVSAIQQVISKAIAEGNSVREESSGWEKVRRVTHMSTNISDALWTDVQ